MTLPAAFPINIQQINVELGRAAGAAFSMLGAEERALANVLAGQVSLSDFLGKSSRDVTLVHSSAADTEVANYGADVAGRWLCIVAHGGDNSGNYTMACTVSGAGAPLIVNHSNCVSAGSQGSATAIFRAQPAGASGTIGLSGGGGAPKRFFVYRVLGYNLAAVTDTDAASPFSINVPANGLVICGVTNDGGTGSPVLSGLTSRATNTFGGKRGNTGMDFNMGADPAKVVSASPYSSTIGASSAVAASFAPS